MSRDFAEYKTFFNNVKKEFIQRIDEEWQLVDDNTLQKPGFDFTKQMEDVGQCTALSLSEKLNFQFELRDYSMRLEELNATLSRLDFDKNPVEFVKAIRQLLLISDPNLSIFLSSGTLNYSAVAKSVQDFLSSPPLFPEEIKIQRLKENFPAIDFFKIKENLLQYAEQAPVIKNLIITSIQTLNLLNVHDCWELVRKASLFLKLSNNRTLFLDLLGPAALNLSKKEREEMFNAVLGGKEIPIFPEKCLEEKRLIVLQDKGFDIKKLKNSLLDYINKAQTRIAEKVLALHDAPVEDIPAKESYIKTGRKLKEMSTALACLQTSDPLDCDKISQLALFFCKEAFSGLRGTRAIFSEARSEKPEKTESCYNEFAGIISYDPSVVKSALTGPSATTRSAQQLGSQGMFAKETEAGSLPPPHRPGTAKPKQ